MPQRPNEPHDGHRHVPTEPCPGYFECERCGYRWIDVDVLRHVPPPQEIINWLHHSRGPAYRPTGAHTIEHGVIAAEY
jgi:hypothetical protein